MQRITIKFGSHSLNLQQEVHQIITNQNEETTEILKIPVLYLVILFIKDILIDDEIEEGEIWSETTSKTIDYHMKNKSKNIKIAKV